MFEVRETTEFYTPRGAISRTESRVVFTSECVIAATKYRYDNAKNGHTVKLDRFSNITLRTFLDGKPFGFAQAFRLVEGDAAYQAVLDETAPAQCEETWVAGKMAA